MNALLLVALCQVDPVRPPLPPVDGPEAVRRAQVEEVPKSSGRNVWSIATPLFSGVAMATTGAKIGDQFNLHGENLYAPIWGFLAGAAAGAVIGLTVGLFAREGIIGAQIASVVLWALGSVALFYDGVVIKNILR